MTGNSSGWIGNVRLRCDLVLRSWDRSDLRLLRVVSVSIYALDEQLIDSIMQNVPGFFSKDEEHFERDLCQTVSLGFCGRHPYGLQPERIEEQEAEVQRHEERSQGIDAMLDEELQRTGADPQEIDEYFQTSTAVRERVTARQRAYAGWLILNPGYRMEVDRLRARWREVVRTVGRFPRLPMAWLTDPGEEASSGHETFVVHLLHTTEVRGSHDMSRWVRIPPLR